MHLPNPGLLAFRALVLVVTVTIVLLMPAAVFVVVAMMTSVMAMIVAVMPATGAAWLAAALSARADFLLATLPNRPGSDINMAHRVGRVVAFDHQLAERRIVVRRVVLDDDIEA